MPRAALLALVVLAASLLVVGSSPAGEARSSGGVVWSGDFRPDAFAWSGLQARNGGFAVVAAPGRAGWAGRFVVRPGDAPVGTGERSEVFRRSSESDGDESIWTWSVLFPPEFRSNPNSTWNVFTQWHHSGTSGVSPVLFEVHNKSGHERLRFSVRGGDQARPERRAWSLEPLVRGKWYEFVLRVRWAADRKGSVQLWVNARRVVSAVGLPTLYEGQSVYLKQGFYRAPSVLTTALYVAGTRQVDTLDGLVPSASSRRQIDP